MNRKLSPETRCKYVHVRSDAASMRHTVSDNGSHSMSLTVNGTAVKSIIKSLAGGDYEQRNSYFGTGENLARYFF